MEIHCNLYQMKVGDNRILPPDILIDVEGELKYLYNTLENGVISQGIQYDKDNIDEVTEQCKKISKEMLELFNLIRSDK